jgi:hypothetical protein
LRVKIAKQKDVSLAKLPPCEASFVQHVLRASLQTYIWMKSDTACITRYLMTFQNHWFISTHYSNKATVRCKNYMFISSSLSSSAVWVNGFISSLIHIK